MRSSRMLLAAAAASAVLAVTAPGAYAADGWDHDDSSYGKEHDKGGKEHDKGSSHDGPHGGMHTGGGALTAVNDGGSDGDHSAKHDSQSSKDSEHGGKDSTWTKDSEDGGKDSSWTKDSEESWSGGHEKPSGGIHTGGGALATPAVTAGGLAVLAVAGSGLYAARRKKSVPGPA